MNEIHESPEDGTLLYSLSWGDEALKLHNETIKAGSTIADSLAAYFQAKRDKELGRWRWPEHPEYVVYPVIQPGHEMAFGPELSVMVFHEPTGVLKGYCRAEDEGGELTREYPRAARAYFEAHPPEPDWKSAQPGEVWLLTVDGREAAYTADRKYFNGSTEEGNFLGFQIDGGTLGVEITAGRRIFPEED